MPGVTACAFTITQVDAYVKAEKKFALAPIFPDAEVERTSVLRLTSRLDAYLARLDGDKPRCARLRATLERYQFGMGLPVGPPKSYASGVDEAIGAAGTATNVAYLRTALVGSWRKIKSEKLALREEAYVPGAFKRKLAKLGTATKQREEGESRELRSAEELRAAAAARQPLPSRRRICDSTLPQLTTALIGERVEVCYEIEYDDGEGESY